MRKLTFILGGARSGKSRRAQNLAESISARRILVATAEPFDDEMAQRIARHKADRGQGWETLDAPLELAQALGEQTDPVTVCLVDCLTLWLSNVMHTDRLLEKETKRLLESLRDAVGPVILVSNEVGLGLVPETPLGRQFRDAQGRLNQDVAEICDHVEFVAAGLPITLKS